MPLPRTMLVVDDDPYTRQLIRRVVSRDFDVRLLEAEDGVSALETLLVEQVDLILLDVSMPVMDGMDTLRALRRVDACAEIPVLILAGKADEKQVVHLAALGIDGFLLKPFRPSVLAERITRLMHRAAEAMRTAPVKRRLHLEATSSLLVVDRAPEFCSFFRDQLAQLCEVLVAPSFPAALALCATHLPDAVFVGTVDKGLERELFARKVRAISPTSPSYLVAVDSAATLTEDDGHLYDAVVPRSYVPETLRRALRGVLSEPTAARWLLAHSGQCLTALRLRVEDHLQSTLGRNMLHSERPAWRVGSGRWVSAALEVQVHDLAWDLVVQMPAVAALSVGAAMSGLSPDEVSDEGVRTSMAMLAETLGGLFVAEARAESLSLVCCEPRVTTSKAYVAAAAREGRNCGVDWWWTFEGSPYGAVVSVTPLAHSLRH